MYNLIDADEENENENKEETEEETEEETQEDDDEDNEEPRGREREEGGPRVAEDSRGQHAPVRDCAYRQGR